MTQLSWTDPVPERIASGITRLPLPLPNDGLRAVNVYAIETGEGIVLIDGGWDLPAGRAALTRQLETLGYSLGDVREILVTHFHRDHYTMAVALRRECGTPIALGVGERPNLESLLVPGRDIYPPGYAELGRRGAQELAHEIAPTLDTVTVTDPGNWALPNRWIEDGSTTKIGERRLRAIATPGHTRGHVTYWLENEALLFSGDHVLPHITPSIGFERAATELPLRDYLKSLALIRLMPDAKLAPAHGPIIASTHSRVDELLDHHAQRLELCRRAVAQGAATAYEVAQCIPWTKRQVSFSDLRLRDRMMAVSETTAHLKLLTLDAAIRMSTDDGVERYLAIKGRSQPWR